MNPTPVMTIAQNSEITFSADSTEMLRITPDGFYVRGKKLKVDDREAIEVYNSFNAWLAWAQLTKGE